MIGIFITGTDTAVGKTWVAVHLIYALKHRGHPVRALKPVESGCPLQDDGQLFAPDATALCQAVGGVKAEAVVKYRWHSALAPGVAAERKGVSISLQELVEFCRGSGVAVVEGAGGWRVPIAGDGEVRDLAAALELAVLVVAEDRLGAINQTLLTCDSVQRTPGCRLAGVILNRLDKSAEILENARVLRESLAVPVWETARDQWLESNQEDDILNTFAGSR